MRFYLCGDGLDKWLSFFILPSVMATCKVALPFSSQELNICHNSFNISWCCNLLWSMECSDFPDLLRIAPVHKHTQSFETCGAELTLTPQSTFQHRVS